MLRIWRRDDTNSGLIDFGSVTRRSFTLSNLRSVQRRFFILTILGPWGDYFLVWRFWIDDETLIPWRVLRDDAFLIIYYYFYFFPILELRDDFLFGRILEGTGKYFILWIPKTEETIEPFSTLTALCGGRLYWAFQTGAENIPPPPHNLKRFKAIVYFWRSLSGDEMTFIPAIQQVLPDELRFWLISRGVWKILGLNDSKMVKTKRFCLWTDLADFLREFSYLPLISLGGCRCEISGSRTPARPSVKFWTLKHLFWVERG